MAEIIGEFGGVVGGGSLGGGATPPSVTTSPFLGLDLDTTYGVPTSEWDTWTLDRRARYLTDYNRPQAQADYYKTQPFLVDTAYAYTGLVDVALGTDASEIGASVNTAIADTKQKISYVAGTATDIVPIVVLLGLAFIASR